MQIQFHLVHIEFQLVQIEFDWCILSFNYEYKYLITLHRTSFDVINILAIFSYGKSFEKKKLEPQGIGLATYYRSSASPKKKYTSLEIDECLS